jgi:hypothetical protein
MNKKQGSIEKYKICKICVNAAYMLISIVFIALFAITKSYLYMTLSFAFSIVFALSKIIGLYLDNRNEHKLLSGIYIAYNVATSITCLLISLDISQAKWLLFIIIILEIVSFFAGGPAYIYGELTDYLDIPFLFSLSLLSLFIYPIHEIINVVKYDEEVDSSSIIDEHKE